MSAPEIKSPPAFLKRIPLSRIDAVVSAHLGPARVENKEQPAVFNRQIAMYLAKNVAGWTTTAIGRFYHGRDHSTVCYSIQRIKILREISQEVDAVVRKLEEALKNPQQTGDCLPIDRPPAVRLDQLREDALLDKLAERIALRVAGLVTEAGISTRLAPAVHNPAQPNDSPEYEMQKSTMNA